MITPYGGKLVNRITPGEDLQSRVEGPHIKRDLTASERIHLINICTGVYSPLTGFMDQVTCARVLDNHELCSGLPWTIPILLPLEKHLESQLASGMTISLLWQGNLIGVLEVNDVFSIDPRICCDRIMGTRNEAHPGARAQLAEPGLYLAGSVLMSQEALPDMRYWRQPQMLRSWLASRELKKITAFATRNVCHFGHEYLQRTALEISDVLGINVLTGASKPGNFKSPIVFDTYECLLEQYYPHSRVFLNNLWIPPLYAGPKEAFLQAIMLQNYGYSHFIVGRNHAGIGDFYAKYAAQEIFACHPGLSIKILPLAGPRFCLECNKVTTEKSCAHSDPRQLLELSGTRVRAHLRDKNYPPEIANIIRKEFLETLIKLPPDEIFDD